MIFRKLRRRLYLRSCKININAEQGARLNMVVHVVKDNEVMETYTMCIDRDNVGDDEMSRYVEEKLLEVKKWQ